MTVPQALQALQLYLTVGLIVGIAWSEEIKLECETPISTVVIGAAIDWPIIGIAWSFGGRPDCAYSDPKKKVSP